MRSTVPILASVEPSAYWIVGDLRQRQVLGPRDVGERVEQHDRDDHHGGEQPEEPGAEDQRRGAAPAGGRVMAASALLAPRRRTRRWCAHCGRTGLQSSSGRRPPDRVSVGRRSLLGLQVAQPSSVGGRSVVIAEHGYMPEPRTGGSSQAGRLPTGSGLVAAGCGSGRGVGRLGLRRRSRPRAAAGAAAGRPATGAAAARRRAPATSSRASPSPTLAATASDSMTMQNGQAVEMTSGSRPSASSVRSTLIRLPIFSSIQNRAPPAPQQKPRSLQRCISCELQALDGAEHLARRRVDLVVPAEVARVVVGDASCRPARPGSACPPRRACRAAACGARPRSGRRAAGTRWPGC